MINKELLLFLLLLLIYLRALVFLNSSRAVATGSSCIFFPFLVDCLTLKCAFTIHPNICCQSTFFFFFFQSLLPEAGIPFQYQISSSCDLGDVIEQIDAFVENDAPPSITKFFAILF